MFMWSEILKPEIILEAFPVAQFCFAATIERLLCAPIIGAELKTSYVKYFNVLRET